MIKEIGCAGSIVGHSERRELFGETNEDVNRKVKALVEAGLYAIVCVGESLAVRDEGTTEEFVCAQVRAAVRRRGRRRRAALRGGLRAHLGHRHRQAPPPPEQAEEVCGAIRATLADAVRRGGRRGDPRALRRLHEARATSRASWPSPNIDGGLIGGASLKAASFVQLINACL